ncbi:expressed unknown protein [Seminavis robusta]|uniref:SHSP domain-containing protein n=1 Tax=Seminavis robusta TaxID=568900 RepID=A0A9N8H2M7_9STRA|nr:expressed unknown protein [Seminavis robusta]|eukprot:Sro21_g014790.1 n/a (264) ;mRNA; f:102127-102918
MAYKNKQQSSQASLLDQCVSYMAASAVRESASSSTASASSTTSTTTAFTSVRFCENARFIRLSVQVPGVLLKDVGVELQRGVLIIRGMRETTLAHGLRHQHKFCRRFAMDTDVVDSTKLKANLNRQGLLTIMAPKKSRPKQTLSVQVTQQDDYDFERSVLGSFVQAQQAASPSTSVSANSSAAATAVSSAPKTTAAPSRQMQNKKSKPALTNVVSMGSASDLLSSRTSNNNMGTRSTIRRNYKPSTLQSHLMIRRSQSKKSMR